MVNLLKTGDIKHGTIASIAPGQILVGVGAKSEGIINGAEFEAIPADEFAAMQVGQDILVYVVTPEDQNGNLILSYVRALEETTWQEAEKYQTSKEAFKGQIVGFNKGGLAGFIWKAARFCAGFTIQFFQAVRPQRRKRRTKLWTHGRAGNQCLHH